MPKPIAKTAFKAFLDKDPKGNSMTSQASPSDVSATAALAKSDAEAHIAKMRSEGPDEDKATAQTDDDKVLNGMTDDEKENWKRGIWTANSKAIYNRNRTAMLTE